MKIKNVFRIALLPAATALLTAGCGGPSAAGQKANADTLATLYQPRYARHFELLTDTAGRTVLRIFDPWQGAVDVTNDYRLPDSGGRFVCMSSSHVAYLAVLGCTDSIAGVSGREFITNEKIRQRAVPDIGYEGSLNYELIVSLRPGCFLAYEVSGENSGPLDKLRQMGVPVLCVADYLEQHPLGRAEWVVAFGAMTGRMQEALNIFAGIEQRYLHIQSVAAAHTAGTTGSARISVMLNAPYRDVWYVPGDRSYMVQLIRDAGGRYAAEGVDSDASRPISTERAYELMLGADRWLNPGAGIRDMAALKAANPRFGKLPVVQRGEVFNSTRRTTPAGGSDFWESGSLRADLALRDITLILYPALYDSLSYGREYALPGETWNASDGNPFYYFELLFPDLPPIMSAPPVGIRDDGIEPVPPSAARRNNS